MPNSNGDYNRGYQAGYVAGVRRAYLEDKACGVCGGTERLEVDHIDRAAKVSHSVWSWSPERRKAELAKCQILCKRCHLDKTIAERRATVWPHGTLQRYKSRLRPCRCEACRSANNAYVRERRASTR